MTESRWAGGSAGEARTFDPSHALRTIAGVRRSVVGDMAALSRIAPLAMAAALIVGAWSAAAAKGDERAGSPAQDVGAGAWGVPLILLAPDPLARVPRRQMVPAGREVQKTGPPVYIARGRVGRVEWGLTARPCRHGGVTTIATALVLSDGSAGASPCETVDPARGPAPTPVLRPDFSYAGGIGRSFVDGVVPARVASVELHIERYSRATRRAPSANRRVVRVPTRPFLAGAQSQGRLPAGLRSFVYVTRGNFVYTRAIASTASGRALLDCTRRQCDRLAR